MSITIPVAHDFSCPWCWIGFLQVKRLEREFGVTFDWKAYELWPQELEIPAPTPAPPAANPDRPVTPSRLSLAYAAEGIPKPTQRPAWNLRTHRAHEMVEFAKLSGSHHLVIERLYRAVWEQGRNIDDPETLIELAEGVISNPHELYSVWEERRFADQIVGFDDSAYASGVYNVPTFWIGGRRFAEESYASLRDAVARELASPEGPPRSSAIYAHLNFPGPPHDRPYVVINMVSTLDGKTVSGERNEPVTDLGSSIDHATMRNLQAQVDAVMLGAGSLRATPGLWYPAPLRRIVISGSGRVDAQSRFFTDAPDRAWVVTPEWVTVSPELQPYHQAFGSDALDFEALLRSLRQDCGVEKLLVEGGSELNAELLRRDLVDEVFLTLAPKMKLGRDTPTYAGGEPLPRGKLLDFQLVSSTPVGSELFLRYRRNRISGG